MAYGNPPRVYRPQRVVATLQKDARPAFPPEHSVLNGPADVIAGMADYMTRRATELFVALFVDVRNRVIGFTELSSGETASVTVHPGGIFREALLANAAAIITVHQHPTGVATPSNEDRDLWRRLTAAGELIGVPVIDNFVLGEDEYFSEREGATSAIPSIARHARSLAAESRRK